MSVCLHEKHLEECLAHNHSSTNVNYYFTQWFVNLQGWLLVEMSTKNLINPVKDNMPNAKYNFEISIS